MTKKSEIIGVISKMSVLDALHGAGLELLLMTEELMYATRSLDEEECYAVGDRLYMLVQVLGSVLVQNKRALATINVELPDTMGAVRIQNPYYEPRSGNPPDKAEGQPDEPVGEHPF